MKKKTILLIFFIVIGLLLYAILSFFVSSDGYYRDIDKARAAEKIYKDYDQLFSVEMNDAIIDFIVHENIFYVTKIMCRENFGKQQYCVKSISTYSFDSLINRLQLIDDYDWHNEPGLGRKKELNWCIVNKTFDLPNNSDFFELYYNEEIFYLCYQKIIE